MPRYVVTHEQLEELASTLQSAAGSIEQELDAVRMKMEPLSAVWAGAAAASFQQKWDEWITSQRQLLESMRAIARAIEAASTAYEDAEAQMASRFL